MNADRDCQIARLRTYRDSPEGRAARDAQYAARSPEQKAREYEGREQRRRANPQKSRAKDAVGNAIKAGTLIREPCERCGTEPTHAHHERYDRPLDVTWLCSVCHGLRHREINDANRGA